MDGSKGHSVKFTFFVIGDLPRMLVVEHLVVLLRYFAPEALQATEKLLHPSPLDDVDAKLCRILIGTGNPIEARVSGFIRIRTD